MLSKRELEVESLLKQGLTYQECADKLCIALGTVNTHIHRVFKKRKVRSIRELLLQKEKNCFCAACIACGVPEDCQLKRLLKQIKEVEELRKLL